MKILGASVCTMMLAVFALSSELSTAHVISIKKYDRGRIAYWEGSVPIYDDYPVYDITIKVGAETHIVRYESLTGYYPRLWSVGNEIKVKQERGQFVLMNGEEAVKARTVSQHDCEPHSTRPLGMRSTSQLPCQ